MRLSFSRTLLLLPLAGVLIAASSGPVSQGYEPVVQIMPPPIIGALPGQSVGGQTVAASAIGKDKPYLTDFPCKKLVAAGSITKMGFNLQTMKRHDVTYALEFQKKNSAGEWVKANPESEYRTDVKWREPFLVDEFSDAPPAGSKEVAQGSSFDIAFAKGTYRLVLTHLKTTSNEKPTWKSDTSDEVICP